MRAMPRRSSGRAEPASHGRRRTIRNSGTVAFPKPRRLERRSRPVSTAVSRQGDDQVHVRLRGRRQESNTNASTIPNATTIAPRDQRSRYDRQLAHRRPGDGWASSQRENAPGPRSSTPEEWAPADRGAPQKVLCKFVAFSSGAVKSRGTTGHREIFSTTQETIRASAPDRFA
jgi:hypothetical protein